MKKTFKEFLKEKTGVIYSKTCLMADIPKYLNLPGVDYDDSESGVVVGQSYNTYSNFVDKFVKKEDLYDDDGTKGKETSPHITILYGGFIQNAEKDLLTIRRLVKQIRPLKITLGKIDKFRQDNYDVLKISVIPSVALNNLHALVKNNIENDYEYPVYMPHVTLAYVIPGSCEELVGNDTFEGIEITVDHFDFSMGDGTLKSVYIPYSKVEVNNIVENGIAPIAPLKPLDEDGDGGGSSGDGPSTVTPSSIETGQRPTRGFVIRRNGSPKKKFKESYKGIAFMYADRNNASIHNPTSEYGTGDSGATH